ncbi:MAG TPA: hypothetical protein VF177_17655 [Anaerolineae bacterium]
MKKAMPSGQQENRKETQVKRYLKSIRLWLSPPCPWIAILGVDGSGKSSVLQALSERFLAAPIAGVKVIHRRPALVYPANEQKPGEPITHYSKPAHGKVKSTVKLVVMVLDWLFGYWGQLAHQRAQGYLLFCDRHSLLDMIADPLRYRYGGSAWLVRLALRLVPMPDLVLLLDAPVAVLQARKQELPIEEVTRQRQAYLELIRMLPNGRIIDASRPLNQVVAKAEDVISTHMNALSHSRSDSDV